MRTPGKSGRKASMSNSQLPQRASLEYLTKLAKDRLQEQRREDPQAKLTSALRPVAHEHGFSSWRALKAHVDQQKAKTVARFFEACVQGEMEILPNLLSDDPTLVRASDANAPHGGWSGLHAAAHAGH